MGTVIIFKSFLIALIVITHGHQKQRGNVECISVKKEISTGEKEISKFDTFYISNECNREYYILMNHNNGLLFNEIRFFENGTKSKGNPDHFEKVKFKKLSINTPIKGYSYYKSLTSEADSVKVSIFLYEEPNLESFKVLKEFRLK